MFRSLIFASTLAAVATPALAAPPSTDLHNSLIASLFVVFLGLNALAVVYALVRRMPTAAAFNAGAVVVLILGCSAHPAFAQEVVATKPGIVLPWGQWIADYGPQIAIFFATWISGVITWALGKWAPWSTSVLTQQRIEQAAQALAQYGAKAVANSTRDGKVTINAGPAVIQTAVQRGVNVLPARLLKAIEKGGGLASIVFRVLDLEDGASEQNVLKPAIASLKSSTDQKAAKAA